MVDRNAIAWITAFTKRLKRTLRSDELASVATLRFRSRVLSIKARYYCEGSPAAPCALVQDGVLCQSKLTSDGNRQIVGVRLINEFVGLPNLFLRETDHDAQALTPCRVLEVDQRSISWLAQRHPDIGHMLVADALVTGSIAQDWIINIGRRDPRCRVAHLLCELALRIDGSSLSPGASFRLPFHQQQLGDAVGLGRVAVNRVLRELASARLISHERGCITIINAKLLEELGDFTARYLHLGQSGHDRRAKERSSGASGGSAPFSAAPSPARERTEPGDELRPLHH